MGSEIALGIGSIDAQHEELVSLFNEFAQAIESDLSLDLVSQIVQRALASANAHFEHEEGLIDQTRYPQAAEHKLLHRRLRMELTTLAGGAMSMHMHDSVTLEQLQTMLGVLRDHIAGPDTQLAEHLKAAGIK